MLLIYKPGVLALQWRYSKYENKYNNNETVDGFSVRIHFRSHVARPNNLNLLRICIAQV